VGTGTRTASRTDVKNFPRALIAVIAFIHVGSASSHERPPSEATALDSFVARSGVVEHLDEIGSVRTDVAVVFAAALIVFDPPTPARS
jgi:hypothetical protein